MAGNEIQYGTDTAAVLRAWPAGQPARSQVYRGQSIYLSIIRRLTFGPKGKTPLGFSYSV
jgi:hypothetical protein